MNNYDQKDYEQKVVGLPEVTRKNKMVAPAVVFMKKGGKLVKGIINRFDNLSKDSLKDLKTDIAFKLDEYDANTIDEQKSLAHEIDSIVSEIDDENNNDRSISDAIALSNLNEKYRNQEKDYLKNLFLYHNINNYNAKNLKIGFFAKHSLKKNANISSQKLYDGMMEAFSDIEKGLNGITYKKFNNLGKEVGYNAVIQMYYSEKIESGNELTKLKKMELSDKIFVQLSTSNFSLESYRDNLKTMFPKNELSEYLDEVEFTGDSLDQAGRLGFHFAIEKYNEWLDAKVAEPFKIENIVSIDNAAEYFDMSLMVLFLKENGIKEIINSDMAKELIEKLINSLELKKDANEKSEVEDSFLKETIKKETSVTQVQLTTVIYNCYNNAKNSNLKSVTMSEEYKKICDATLAENNLNQINLLRTVTQFCDSGIFDIWSKKQDAYGLNSIIGFSDIACYMTQNHLKVLENYNFIEKSEDIFDKSEDENIADEKNIEESISDIKETLATTVEEILNEKGKNMNYDYNNNPKTSNDSEEVSELPRVIYLEDKLKPLLLEDKQLQKMNQPQEGKKVNSLFNNSPKQEETEGYSQKALNIMAIQNSSMNDLYHEGVIVGRQEMQNEKNQLAKENSNLTTQLANANQLNNNLTKELDSTKKEIVTEKNVLNTKIEEKDKEISTIKEEKEKLVNNNSYLKNQVEELTKIINAARETNQKLSKENAELNENLQIFNEAWKKINGSPKIEEEHSKTI